MPKTATHIANIAANRQTQAAGGAPTVARRALFAGAALLVGAPVAAADANPNPDAELIDRCQRFAESFLKAWYLAYLAATDFPDAAYDAHGDEVQWIEETPAATPDGWRAKALAFSAWQSGDYDTDGRPFDNSALAVSLMRDMAGPARAAILTRLVEQFGALPGRTVTADGRWLEIAA